MAKFNRREFIGVGAGAAVAAAAGAAYGATAGRGPHEVAELLQSAPADGDRFPGDPGRGHLYYGASLMPTLSLPSLERELNHRLTLHRSYFGAWEWRALLARARRDHHHRRLPLLSIKLPGTWAMVAAGRRDRWLRTLLEGLARQGRPVMLALHHEPENDVGGEGMRPADWVAMQRHAMALASHHSRRITVVPVLMAWTFDRRSGRDPATWWLPEARVMGIDCYNPWSPSAGARWVSFAETMGPIRQYARDQPLLVAEYGCRTDQSSPGRAAAWMLDAYAFAHRHNIVGMSYFDSSINSPHGSWVLDRERIAAMRWCIRQAQVVQPR